MPNLHSSLIVSFLFYSSFSIASPDLSCESIESQFTCNIFVPLDQDQSAFRYWTWESIDNHDRSLTILIAGVGGPGGSIKKEDVARYMKPFIEANNVKRVVLTNLRGMESDSELSCSGYTSWQKCEQDLKGEGLDLSLYHYRTYAKDSMALMKNLEINEWIVVGGSYSARVAAEMAKQSPESTKAAIIVSPVPLYQSSSVPDSFLDKKSFNKFALACQANTECHAKHPNVILEIDMVIDWLENDYRALKGKDSFSWSKKNFIEQFVTYMKSRDFEYAEQFVYLHINNPDGFSESDIPDKIRGNDYSGFTGVKLFILAKNNGMNGKITRCNEYQVPENKSYIQYNLGVWGSAWGPDLQCLPEQHENKYKTKIAVPAYILFNKYDPIVDASYVSDYLNYFQWSQSIPTELAGHGVTKELLTKTVESIIN